MASTVCCHIWRIGLRSCSLRTIRLRRKRPSPTRAGWKFTMASCAGNSFFKDMGFEPEPKKFWPGVSTFHKDSNGQITLVSQSYFGPGDDFCSLWHFFDLLKDGANNWQPKFRYDSSTGSNRRKAELTRTHFRFIAHRFANAGKSPRRCLPSSCPATASRELHRASSFAAPRMTRSGASIRVFSARAGSDPSRGTAVPSHHPLRDSSDSSR